MGPPRGDAHLNGEVSGSGGGEGEKRRAQQKVENKEGAAGGGRWGGAAPSAPSALSAAAEAAAAAGVSRAGGVVGAQGEDGTGEEQGDVRGESSDTGERRAGAVYASSDGGGVEERRWADERGECGEELGEAGERGAGERGCVAAWFEISVEDEGVGMREEEVQQVIATAQTGARAR